jgi:hypothetical protein
MLFNQANPQIAIDPATAEIAIDGGPCRRSPPTSYR